MRQLGAAAAVKEADVQVQAVRVTAARTKAHRQDANITNAMSSHDGIMAAKRARNNRRLVIPPQH